MDSAVANFQPIYVSSITLIEITYLIEKRRLPESDLLSLLNALEDAGSVHASLSIDIREVRSVAHQSTCFDRLAH